MRALIFADRREFHQGDLVVAEGAISRDLYILASGSIELSVTVDKKRHIVGSLSAPEILGEDSFLAGGQRMANVVAASDVVIYVIDHKKLYNDGVERTPQWFKHLLQVLSNRTASENAMGKIFEKINSLREQPKKQVILKPLELLEDLHVLVVEDDIFNQDLAKKILEKHGHDVKCASNGLEALELISIHNFDLALMDIQMPVMDGVEAVRLIRKCESSHPGSFMEHRELLKGLQQKISGTHLPIIAMTANSSEGEAERCLSSGMDSFINKPFRLQKALTALQSALARKSCQE